MQGKLSERDIMNLSNPEYNLEKSDLINLLKGIGPGTYDDMTLCESFGKLNADKWHWDESAMNESSNEDLWDLYQELKKRRSI
jgi:hypothetical protein